jgi:hypothetical protein
MLSIESIESAWSLQPTPQQTMQVTVIDCFGGLERLTLCMSPVPSLGLVRFVSRLRGRVSA